jgi:CubicO group peptidase (beta-lactamase class C family)
MNNTVDGYVASGFEAVADAFKRNFTEYGDVGAAFAAYQDGDLVVDLWGGLADSRTSQPWSADTLQVVFSASKGLVATCLTILLDRGSLQLEAPVASYWPEFGNAGKADVTIREIVSHQAGLPVIRQSLEANDILDDVRMAVLLASQPLESDPRGTRLYHRLTYGWLCGEIIRRITGKSVGRFFGEEVADPLGLELWIGLPESEEPRVSLISDGSNPPSIPALDPELIAADQLRTLLYSNPTIGLTQFNTAPFHAAEIPGANAIGTARSIARMYACLALGGGLDGVRLCSSEAIELARRELVRFRDPFSQLEMAFGVGFYLQEELALLGPPATAYGHPGAGGSSHGAWPDQAVGFSYAMNERRDARDDPRARGVLKALYEIVCR